jgi:hypothetical protein
MSRAQYFVVSHEGQWKIKFQGQHYGPYNTQRDAIRAAVDAAHKAKGDAQVLVQGHLRVNKDSTTSPAYEPGLTVFAGFLGSPFLAGFRVTSVLWGFGGVFKNV